uniref:(northern house mosquito) hypothetical protein n=1 Tax=Culex pipiens TaxID=7175 RepID=A0A8D8BY97_CULPI
MYKLTLFLISLTAERKALATKTHREDLLYLNMVNLCVWCTIKRLQLSVFCSRLKLFIFSLCYFSFSVWQTRIQAIILFKWRIKIIWLYWLCFTKMCSVFFPFMAFICMCVALLLLKSFFFKL